MAAFQYGGIVAAEPVKTEEYTCRHVFDAANNYQFTEVTITVSFVFNPKSTSYAAPVAFAPPVPVEGKLPAETEAAVRHALAQPRQTLIYSNGANTIIRSPAVGATVDANNGPVPTVHSVRAVHGIKTFEVRMSVKTYLNESHLYVNTPSVITSHTWRPQHTVDADFFCTRVIRGRVACRSDRLAALNASVDDFRRFVFHPVPTNFKRETIDIVASEDGTSAEYTIIDRELPINIVAPQGVTRIEASWSQGSHGIGPEEYAWREMLAEEGILTSSPAYMGNAALGASAAGHGMARSGWAQNAFQNDGVSTGAVHTAASLASMAVGAKLRYEVNRITNAPRHVHDIAVRVWGDRTASRQMLQNVAVGIAQSRLAFLVDKKFATLGFRVTHDLMGRFVAYSCSLVSGPSNDVVATGPNLGSLPFPGFPADDSMPNFTSANDAANPAPTGDGKSRGSYLGALLAAALQAPNATPSTPADPRQAQVLNP